MNILEKLEDNDNVCFLIICLVIPIVLSLFLIIKTYLDNQVSIEAIKAGLEQTERGLWVKPKQLVEKVDQK
jgi:hypothetical protein